jgi:asparagine synthase (glutamine-hydrolysing)
MKILVDEAYGWKKIQILAYTVHFITPGDGEELLTICEAIAKLGAHPDSRMIDRLLEKQTIPAGAVMRSPNSLIAFVDQLRCYPLYYTTHPLPAVSNNARHLINAMGINKAWDPVAAEEFCMTGYVTGSDSLIKGIKQLQAGERLIVSLTSAQLDIKRYYVYSPKPDGGRNDSDWINELDDVLTRVTTRVVERAKGRPIQITLSAGLDSRLIACKLHETKYDDLQMFSYGPAGNWEARGAKRVAKRLRIPWTFVNTTRGEARRLFSHLDRKKYWDFADGLSAQPNFQEYFTIHKLHYLGYFPDNVILINGQSGDFISGGHIPQTLFRPNANVTTLLGAIIGKHYALWRSLMTPERVARMEERILKSLDIAKTDGLSSDELMSLYEQWECSERQAKWVIHAQRVNDFFGYDWQLPLWDIELVHFFERVPNHLKFNQTLYRLWLEKWNYRDLFKHFRPTVWSWPGPTLAVLPIGMGIELFFGHPLKQKWFEIMNYWGHNTEHFAPYSYADYFRVCHDIRNCISLNGRTWAKENRLPTDVVDIGQGSLE